MMQVVEATAYTPVLMRVVCNVALDEPSPPPAVRTRSTDGIDRKGHP
jgi:hypothetical protein